MSAGQQGVELPAIAWPQTLGYTPVPGNAVNVDLRHQAPVQEGVLRPRLLARRCFRADSRSKRQCVTVELGQPVLLRGRRAWSSPRKRPWYVSGRVGSAKGRHTGSNPRCQPM